MSRGCRRGGSPSRRPLLRFGGVCCSLRARMADAAGVRPSRPPTQGFSGVGRGTAFSSGAAAGARKTTPYGAFGASRHAILVEKEKGSAVEVARAWIWSVAARGGRRRRRDDGHARRTEATGSDRSTPLSTCAKIRRPTGHVREKELNI